MFSSNTSAVSGDANYIEDVFSTWLTSGTGAAQSVANGINLSTYGGLIWEKLRGPGTQNHSLTDTARGLNTQLNTNSTGTGTTSTSAITAFNTDGFNFGTAYSGSGDTNVFWTFRKQPKFFDVVTYTGNASSRTISHNLGSVPACIIVKNTSATGSWVVYHRSLSSPTSSYLKLETTDAVVTGNTYIWDNTAPTSTVFSVGASGFTNNTGENYVAYIFAHDAGGFGLTGTDNVISCGSVAATAGSSTDVTLGYEPQWILFRDINNADNWKLVDTMRGLSQTSQTFLFPNKTDTDTATSGWLVPTATGFTAQSSFNTSTYIYIAIRRGPMKVPTDGTKVFNLANKPSSPYTVGFPTDMAFWKWADGSQSFYWKDRLRGTTASLTSATTSAEASTGTTSWDLQNQIADTNFVGTLYYMGYYLRRSPSFFDEVCYTGNGSNITVNHNLTVVPELIIGKCRDSGYGWLVYNKDIGSTGGYPNYLKLHDTTATSSGGSTLWGTPTSTTFSYGSNATLNASGFTFVAYLFATCPGVSKVGSYTGTGTTKQVDCGFAAGARFVLIKRTDSSGDWYVWDTARGIVSGNDPYLLLNTTDAEVTSTDYIDTYSAGFELSSTAPAALNASGGTYIFLAIA